jgi:hypothetical protein
VSCKFIIITKALIPFSLTLLLGVGLHLVLFPRRLKVSIEPPAFKEISAPISNVSVPDIDFPQQVMRSPKFFGGSQRFRALFDADGTVRQVEPYPMLPYNVPESAAGHGEFSDYTSAMSDGKFVKALPFGLTELAIKQLRETTFTPATSRNRAVSKWVMVNVEFSYAENRYATGCSEIDVTIMDEQGVVWKGNTWARRELGCIRF